jgi:sigma-B regulation protein RsbU (phosphoserine phosphatase)
MAKLHIDSREGASQDLELLSPEITIGRGSDNTLHFRDPWLSRSHARIVLRDGRYFLEDLSSRNGTYLNGQAIAAPHALVNGDVVSLGDLRLTYHDSGSGTFRVADSAVSLVGKGTVILSSDELRLDRYQEAFRHARQKEKPRGSELVASATETPWLTLNEVAAALISHFPLEQLVQRVIELVLGALPAERGALLLRNERAGGQLEVMARRGYTDLEEIRISRTIMEVVLEARQAILTMDAQADQRFDSAASIRMQGIRSVMCVPLINNDQTVIGLIYLDDRVASPLFTENSLRLVGLIANLAAVKIENCFLLEGQIEKKRMEEQLAVGSQIQRRLLPAREPTIAGYEVCAGYQSCFEVGGDYYDFIRKENGRWVILIADIAGKGVGAALLMAVLQASVRALVPVMTDPAELVSRLNRVLVESSPANKFATLFYAELDTERQVIEYVSGGHNPSLLVVDGGIQELGATGPVVGMVAKATFKSRKVDFPPGATLVLYTDGVTELMNESDEEFGTPRLCEVIRSSLALDAPKLVELIHEEMVAFAQSQRFSDDSTVVVIRHHAVGAEKVG